MARTPLFRELMRLLKLARQARAARVHAAELYGLRRERAKFSRRQLLEGGLASLALPLLTNCEAQVDGNEATAPRIAIVGGGLAGLHCALRLQEAGLRSTIYEASGRFGGRVYSDRTTFADQQHCELGGELIDTGHETMRDLADEFGLQLLDFDEDDAELNWLTAYFGDGPLTMEQILEGFAPIAKAIDEALGTLTDQEDLFVYYDKPNGGEALDALSISAWLDQIGASGPVRKLLEVAYNIEFGVEPTEQNVLNMMVLISTDTSAFDVFGESDERFKVAGGNDQIPSAILESLLGVELETGASLLALAPRGTGYVLTFERGSGTFEVEADHVVLALPFTRLREVDILVELPPAKRLAIDTLGYGTNSKLMVGFSSRVWREEPHRSNGETFTDLGYQSTWETSRLQAGASGIITNFTGGDAGVYAGTGTPAERALEFLEQFDAVFPGAKDAHDGRLVRFHWPTHRFTQGSYSAYLVGQYTQIAGVESERVGNIHFCGEHTSLDYQGYMEGAALSGAIVAEAIASELGGAAGALASGLLSTSVYSQRVWQRARATRQFRRWRLARRRALRV